MRIPCASLRVQRAPLRPPLLRNSPGEPRHHQACLVGALLRTRPDRGVPELRQRLQALKLLLIAWTWEQVTRFINRFGDPFSSEEPPRPLVYALQLTGLLLIVSVVVVSVVETDYGNAMTAADDNLSFAAAVTIVAVALLHEFGGIWRPQLRPVAARRRNAALIAAI